MSNRNDVPPSTLGVEVREGSVAVDYLDGRTVTYAGSPEEVEGELRCKPGKDVHVLVTDDSETQGVLVYVNDRNTHDDILEETGVGRVFVEEGGEEVLFPGVRAAVEAHRVEVSVDFDVADGRVFVFEEDELGERSYEVVSPEE
jgi:F420-0:gamma-glutamyl ligase-like protein